MNPKLAFLSILFCLLVACEPNPNSSNDANFSAITGVEPQPLLAQAKRVSEALSFIGNPLPNDIAEQIRILEELPYDAETVQKVQELLDPFCLAMVHINPESRVKVGRGFAQARMIQEGWTSYLVKVHNEAGISAELLAESPNALPVLHRSSGAHRMKKENYISPGDLDNQFI